MKPNYSTWDGKRDNTAQSRAWEAFDGASCGWQHLTEDQYRTWEEAAKKERRRRRWPASRRFTGQSLYPEINFVFAQQTVRPSQRLMAGPR